MFHKAKVETAVTSPPRPFQRRAFYIHGYDPRSVLLYRKLYIEQAQAYADKFGESIKVGTRKRRSSHIHSWRVAAHIDGGAAETDHEYLAWDDLVLKELKQSFWAGVAAVCAAFWRFLWAGAFVKWFRIYWRSGATMLYPFMMIALYALVAGVIGGAAAGGAMAVGAPALVAWPLGVILAVSVFRQSDRLDGALYVYYLAHNFIYLLRRADGRAPDVAARIDGFGARIHDALGQGADEVLVIGHSSGAHEAVFAAAAALSHGDPPPGARLSLLTLGAVSATFAPFACPSFTAAVKAVAAHPAVDWVDVSAGQDSISYGRVDLLQLFGVDAAPDRVKHISPKWPEAFSRATLRLFRFDHFQRHFLYMRSPDHRPAPGDWNWIAAIAGSQTLAQRYAARKDAGRKARVRVKTAYD